MRNIATVIGQRLGLPVEAMLRETFGPIFATDQPSSSARTQQTLGWEPSHPSLLEDLENIHPDRLPARRLERPKRPAHG